MFISWEDRLTSDEYRDLANEQEVNEAICQEAYERMAEQCWWAAQLSGNIN